LTTHDSHIGSNSQHRLSDQVSANTSDPLGIAVWAAILVLAIAPMPIAYWGPGTFGR
jgi:hypothetical protein